MVLITMTSALNHKKVYRMANKNRETTAEYRESRLTLFHLEQRTRFVIEL